MSTCDAWARFHEEDVQFDAECDLPASMGHAEWPNLPDPIHHDPDLGDWDHVTGLHDRSLTPAESRLKR